MRVTVIMGAYNAERTVERAVLSVMHQTFSDLKMVVCDDGSSDGTFSVLKKLESQWPGKLCVIRNKTNLTVAGALNHCLEYAEGDYIAVMDADDWSFPDRIRTEAEFLDSHQEYAYVGSALEVDNGETTFLRTYEEYPTLDKLLRGGYPYAHPTLMVRLPVMKAAGGYDNSASYRRCEDLELGYRILQRGYRGYNLQAPLLRYSESPYDFIRRSRKNATLQFLLRKARRKQEKKPFYYDLYYCRSLIFAYLPESVRYLVKKQTRS